MMKSALSVTSKVGTSAAAAVGVVVAGVVMAVASAVTGSNRPDEAVTIVVAVSE